MKESKITVDGRSLEEYIEVQRSQSIQAEMKNSIAKYWGRPIRERYTPPVVENSAVKVYSDEDIFKILVNEYDVPIEDLSEAQLSTMWRGWTRYRAGKWIPALKGVPREKQTTQKALWSLYDYSKKK